MKYTVKLTEAEHSLLIDAVNMLYQYAIDVKKAHPKSDFYREYHDRCEDLADMIGNLNPDTLEG